MKYRIVMLFALLMSAVAHAGTVYVERYGSTQTQASSNASIAWHAQYPNGQYAGIYMCRNIGATQPMSPQWVCVAYGDDGAASTVVVSTSAEASTASAACSAAVSAWNSQYGSQGTVSGTSVVEIYGNGPNSRPTAFRCTASGRIPA